MRAAPGRPAFYALGRGRLGELVTLLHPPYTAWHLSYFALGAAVAPHLHVDRLLWGLAAFALAVGVAAHALDELHDRPLGTTLSERTLIAMAALSLLGALAIGVAGVLSVTALLLPFVVLGGLFLPAYNLELLGGRMHNDLWFALGWGAFPAFTGYFVNARHLSLMLAGGAAALAGVAGVCLALTFTLAPSQIFAWVGVVFAAVMLGGLGSALGPLTAGIVIGVSEAVTMVFASPSWAPIVSFSLLIVLLLVRPGRA